MSAEDAAEMIEEQRESHSFKQKAAIVIAVFAMMLAITGLGGENASSEALNANIQASNLFAFYQAKNQSQTSYMLAADMFEHAFANNANLPEGARAALDAKMEQYRRTVARYESEPATQEGKKELLVRAPSSEIRTHRDALQGPTSASKFQTEDASAIADYLMNLPPIRNKTVGPFEPHEKHTVYVLTLA